MGEGFLGFKKKIMKEFIIKCSILSVALGLIAFGVLFLLDKLSVISFHFAFSILIGVGTIALVFLASYFIFKPSDKKIAKRLDKTFELNEKVQTMVSFKDDNNFIVELQREDTNNRLKNIPLKQLKFSIHYILIILAVLGLGVSITALAYPKAKDNVIVDPGNNEDPPYTVTELQIQKLESLIKDVNNSDISDDMKTKYTGEIVLLITDLKNSTRESEMLANVKKAINNVLSYMIVANTNSKIAKTLFEVSDYEYPDNNKTLKNYGSTNLPNGNFVGNWKNINDASQTISISANNVSYINVNLKDFSCTKLVLKGIYYPAGNDLGDPTDVTLTINEADGTLTDGTNTYVKYDNYSQLKQTAKTMYSYDVEATSQNISIFMAKEYDNLRNESILMFKQKVSADVVALKEMLSACGVDEGDSLYTAFKNYADALNSVSSASDADALTIAKTAIEELRIVVVRELSSMSENRTVAYNIEERLCDIFGLDKPSHTDPELNDGKNNGGSNIDGDDDNNNAGEPNKGGSIGDGDYIYASRDYIFDYDTGKLDVYGKYYTQYYDTIINLINEGSLTPEMEDYLRAYFEKLVSGIEKNNEN